MQPDARLVLVESSAALPGLFPIAAHEVLTRAETVLVRDPATHPSAPYLMMGGVTLVAATPSDNLPRSRNLLSAAGDATSLKLATGLLEAAAHGEVVYLLGPDEESFARTVATEAASSGDVEVEFVWLVGAPEGTELLRLADVMAALRDPETGCPWDLEQDHTTLTRHLVEETYELLDAIESGDDAHLAEELGDVLLQVMFHAQVAKDRGAFSIDDVAAGIANKLVRRHPHVFADGEAATADEVQQNWDAIKAVEKAERTGPFDGVPRALPALMLVEELQRKAAKLGFDWPDVDGPAAKVREELDEVLEAVASEDAEAVADELGDLVMAVVALARQVGVEPEAAARRGADAFRDRFEAVLRRAGREGADPADLTIAQWLDLWAEAKAAGW